ncbi:MAG TPA: GNAT family acetyltransferase [Anaerolineae bacterium]|nr:GNAT family acetyltransferase [Anaerolineae bacterium]
MHIRSYESTDLDEVIALWRTIFPDAPAHNVPLVDIQSKVKVQPELFFVAAEDGKIVGTAMSGYDGHRGWVYYVAVHPDIRRRGIGSALMQKVEAALKEIGCPKLNLQIRAENESVKAFYEALGYQVEDRISMGKRLGSQG